MSSTIDKNEITPVTVSNLIKSQFPMFYQEQGQLFVAFVKAYYEWLESPSNPLYYARRIYAIKDIDTTLDQFIIFFKEKYLKNIQLDTQSDTRLLVKHALDIYRSKGTERCVQLLFQLVYNEPVRFYYPSLDLFKLSSGKWFVPHYLELTLSENNVNLVGKEVVGLNSQAVAFIEEVVRRRTKGRLQDIAYISAIDGVFQTNEKITPVDNSIDIDLCPFITGSLSQILVDSLGTGSGFEVGDIVDVSGTYGEGALARVANTTEQFGIVSFNLDDGGYGYTTSANVYVSNAVLILANVQFTDSNAVHYAKWKDTFNQHIAYLNYQNANGILQVGANITTYFGNGSVMGTGTILNKNQANTSSGTILAQVLTGNLQNTFYTTANAIVANLTLSNGYFDVSASGTFIANTDKAVLTMSSVNNFIIGEFVRQGGTSGIIEGIVGANLVVNTIAGMFRKSLPVSGQTSGISAVPSSIGFTVGLINTVNSFVSFPGNFVNATSITATVENLDESGSGLSMSIANSLLLSENVQYNTDIILPYLSTALNASQYNFPANTTANLTNCPIGSTWSFANLTIGKLSGLITLGTGQNYTQPPLIAIDQAQTYSYHYQDIILDIDSDAEFIEGELVTQAATNARGIVSPYSNSSVLYLQRDRFFPNNKFVVTTNSTTGLVGNISQLAANVLIVSTNTGSESLGHNAKVGTQFSVGNGAITVLDIIDSGFGFTDLEGVTIINDAGDSALGNAHLITSGFGQGFYKVNDGFISDNKKLFDGDFYQNYSYQIISRIMLSKYRDLLLNITHPAGTKMFGRLIHFNNDGLELTAQSSIITIS